MGEQELMNFGQALEALKEGKNVARIGWNGKGMFLYLVNGVEISRTALRGAATIADNKYWELRNEDPSTYTTINSHIDMRAADGTIVVGWSPSQTDMLFNDWLIVE